MSNVKSNPFAGMPFQIREKNLEYALAFLDKYPPAPEDLTDLSGFGEVERSSLRERSALEHAIRLLQDSCRKEGHCPQAANLVSSALVYRRLPKEWVNDFENLLEKDLAHWPTRFLAVCPADWDLDPSDVIVDPSSLDLSQYKPDFDFHFDPSEGRSVVDRLTGNRFVIIVEPWCLENSNPYYWESSVVSMVLQSLRGTKTLQIAIRSQTVPSKASIPRSAKPSAEQESREAVIYAATQKGLQGEPYCQCLKENRIKTPPAWWRNGSPKEYPDAYKIPKFRKLINQEKTRINARMRYLEMNNPERFSRLVRWFQQGSFVH